jgi:curved DNA-binding protein CbpA
MDTLYNLLGALPRDDAEELRTAFRKAVKGAHPDLRPDDPDAAVKFRQIIRANDILLDKDQRAVYDHLLMLAGQEKTAAEAHPIAARIHKIASGVLAFASVSLVTVGGYLLFMHMSVALVAPSGSLAASHATATAADLNTRLTASIAAVSPSDAPDPAAVSAFIAARTDGTSPAGVANAMAMAPADADGTLPSPNLAADPVADHAAVSYAREVLAIGNGETGAKAAESDQMMQLEAKFTVPYADRSLLFFRDKSDENAFGDLRPSKRAEKPGSRAKSAVTVNNKTHAEALPKTVPLPMPRTAPRYYMTPRPAPRYIWQQPWNTAATFQ